MENHDRSNVIQVTVCAGRACHNQSMNIIRILLIIFAALLVPGGLILLIPLIYRWSKQRKILPAESAEISS